MARTTLDIDATVLQTLRRIARESGRTIGEVASELLARALWSAPNQDERFVWKTRDMNACIDLEDGNTANRLLEEH